VEGDVLMGAGTITEQPREQEKLDGSLDLLDSNVMNNADRSRSRSRSRSNLTDALHNTRSTLSRVLKSITLNKSGAQNSAKELNSSDARQQPIEEPSQPNPKALENPISSNGSCKGVICSGCGKETLYPTTSPAKTEGQALSLACCSHYFSNQNMDTFREQRVGHDNRSTKTSAPTSPRQPPAKKMQHAALHQQVLMMQATIHKLGSKYNRLRSQYNVRKMHATGLEFSR
jgi:hypothetical protein